MTEKDEVPPLPKGGTKQGANNPDDILSSRLMKISPLEPRRIRTRSKQKNDLQGTIDIVRGLFAAGRTIVSEKELGPHRYPSEIRRAFERLAGRYPRYLLLEIGPCGYELHRRRSSNWRDRP